jgi:hypothetical protein
MKMVVNDMGEKIGQDALGYGDSLSRSGLSEKEKERLKKKLEEQRRQQRLDDLEGKEIHEGIPDHRKTPETRDGSFDVHVREHKRRTPRRTR